MDISINKQSRFICLTMAIIMVLSIFLSAGTSVYANQITPTKHLTIEKVNEAVGESVYYSEESQQFFIDEVSAKYGGLSDSQISNLKEWIGFLNESPERIKQSLEYAGVTQTTRTKRGIPVPLIKALIHLGKGALVAVGGWIANYGLGGACQKFGDRYKPFRDFCAANGHRVPNDSVGGRPFR